VLAVETFKILLNSPPNRTAPLTHHLFLVFFILILLIVSPLVDSDDFIVGLVSWGRSDCDAEAAPGVYARVSAGWDWINEQVCENALIIPSWAICSTRSEEEQEEQQEESSCNDPDMSRFEWVQCVLLNYIGS
jgi:Trypsin